MPEMRGAAVHLLNRVTDSAEQFSDLHRVERRTLTKIVVRHEQRQPAAIGHTRILADTTHITRITTRSIKRCRHISEFHTGRIGQQ